MTVSVDTTTIVVSGVTAGGEVIVFGRSSRYVGGTPRLRRHSFMQRDEDRDGTVTIIGQSISPYSIWIAVDYESGEFATGAPAGFPRHVIALPQTRPWREGSVDVELSRSYLDFLLVRPGKGAWALDVFQGSARDADGLIDATLQLRISMMRPLFGKDSPPPHAAKKDVLVIIDPKELDMVVVAAE